MKPWIGAMALGLAGLGSGGCWVTKESGKQMQADMVALQTELAVIKKAHHAEKAQLAERLSEAGQRVAELKLLIEEYRRINGRNAADFGVEMEQVKRHLTEMRGQVEVNAHRLRVIEQRLQIIHEDLSSQRTEAEKAEQERLAAEQAAAAEPEKKLPDIERPQDKKEFYKLAHGLLEAGQNRAARILFEEFLEKWPRDAYSDNAWYWIAESHYAEKNYRDAALTFQKVRKKFPEGDKARDALLKLGYCFFAMEMYEESLPFLKEFVQSYPNSPLVRKARQKMRQARRKLR